MWVDAEGVAHTVAPPDWREVLLLQGEHAEVSNDLLEELERQRRLVYDQIESGELGPGGQEGELPNEPIPLHTAAFEDLGLLRSSLAQVDVWWRLDVVEALEDYLDHVDEHG